VLGHPEARGDLCHQFIDGQAMCRGGLMAMGSGALVTPRPGVDKSGTLGCRVLGEAALLVFVAAAAGTGIIASGL